MVLIPKWSQKQVNIEITLTIHNKADNICLEKKTMTI